MKDWQFTKEFNKRKRLLRNKLHGMNQRCYNEYAPSYKWYGGRGIDICDLWLNNPESFILWGMENEYFEHCHIHRLNNHKGYSPDNCVLVSARVHMKMHHSVEREDNEFSLDA